MRRFLAAVMLLGLAGCGSDNGEGSPGGPSDSTLNGTYDLVVRPWPGCGLPGGPFTLVVSVTTFSTNAGEELRATLPTGGDDLALDMLYPVPAQLEGALSTRGGGVPLAGGGRLYLRNNGRGFVSSASSGRAQVADGVMFGEVTYYPDGATGFTCSATDHRWALLPR